MKYCKECGKEIQDDTKYCPSCGTEQYTNKAMPDYPVYRENKTMNEEVGIGATTLIGFIFWFFFWGY